MAHSEKKAREAWDLIKYHYQHGDVPAMDVDESAFNWPPSVEQVRLIYRTIAARVHPDVGGAAEVFRNVTEARITLCGFLEYARPARQAGAVEYKPCEHCGGQGFIKLPSRALGGKGLRKKCADCGGSGVTCH